MLVVLEIGMGATPRTDHSWMSIAIRKTADNCVTLLNAVGKHHMIHMQVFSRSMTF